MPLKYEKLRVSKRTRRPKVKYEILPVSTRIRSITTNRKGTKNLPRTGVLYTDEATAAEVEEKYPFEVMVNPIEITHPSDQGHKFTFTVPELPWKKNEESNQ